MNKYLVSVAARTFSSEAFAALVLSERNRRDYMAQSAATVAGRAAPFHPSSPANTPSLVAGGLEPDYAYEEMMDGREPSTEWSY